MKVLFLISLFLCSCTEYAELKKEGVSLQVAPVKMQISHLKEIEWRVGNRKEKEVSQSFTFLVDLPTVKEEDLEFLIEQKNIDAWILRLIQIRPSQTQDLGSVFAQFKPQKISRTSHASIPTSVSFKVNYAAAFASARFKSFKCPAFGHNKKITSMTIAGENEEFGIDIGKINSYAEKNTKTQLTPASFNGGNTLVGEYQIEIAPYDSKKKIIHGAFQKLPMSVVVKGEESVNIQECEGVHQELN